jgi:indolepyruvate ferredoxin oxidoreductase
MASPFAAELRLPDFKMPEGGLNIRLRDTPVAQEARMIDYKRFAAEAFARANRIDRKVWGKPGAKHRLCRRRQELAGSGPCPCPAGH